MGKSPGKWIKSVIFGKKVSKSSKNSTTERKASAAANAVSGNLAADRPAISDPPPQAIDIGGVNSEVQNGTRVALPCDAVGKQEGAGNASVGSISANNAEIAILEQAATKAQAAFRGFLARRAFSALKGIIQLQALVRGHLVRRQAVATLHCMRAIVKFQALVRGRKVRLCDAGREGLKTCSPRPVDPKQVDLAGVWSENLSKNAFISKLCASLPNALPLSLQYENVEPNSAWNWLERWSLSCFWEPVARPKKTRGSKPRRKLADIQTLDTEPGRPKRGIRKVSAVNGENSSLHPASDHEKLKRNARKALSHQAEPVQEQPQSELERVKRSLKKISLSTEVPSHKSEPVTEKKVPIYPVPDVLDQGINDSSEKIMDLTTTMSEEPTVETPLKPEVDDEPVDILHNDQPTAEQYPLENGGEVERSPIIHEDLRSKEDQISKEDEKTKRRRSFPAKQDYPENVSQNSPNLPSYMAATESAKAKLRAQGSPRFGQDEVENGSARRHSLPSSTGKMNSQSPRMPKPIQANGKGGTRSDRSLMSSRDGWRR